MTLSRLFFALVFVALLALFDWYVLVAIRQWSDALPNGYRRAVLYAVSGLSIGSLLALALLLVTASAYGPVWRNFLLVVVFANFVVKLLMGVFLLMDDLGRAVRWAMRQLTRSPTNPSAPVAAEGAVSRADFMVQAAVVAGAIPLVGIAYGILSGAHDYRVRRVTLRLRNLPGAFDGLRIAQLSDIHSGSFFNKRAVQGGVAMLMAEKPDVVFFTGDLVNNEAREVAEYVPIFGKVRAPLGVYSVLGNHDYGDYRQWASAEAKRQNLRDLIGVHRQLGWDLLMDEHRTLSVGGEQIAIIGNQNWGTKFQQYGNLDKACVGTEAYPVKLLLSHDPTHWDAQVRTRYPGIDATFAGHTHGTQFGVETSGFRWSPAQYIYKQWAGLYQEASPAVGQQYLYVNRGFGYLGFPGRIGILPEITVIELKKG